MNYLHRMIGLGLFATACPAFAQAQDDGITYDCDTAANHFSELVIPAPAAPFVVRGGVRLNQIAKIDKYAPLTRITVSSSTTVPGQAPDNWAGFEISALPAKSIGIRNKGVGDVVQFIKWSERAGAKNVSRDKLDPVEYSDSLPFTLTYDGKNVVGRVGDAEQTIALSADKPVIRLICSTGEFLFTGLKVEKSK